MRSYDYIYIYRKGWTRMEGTNWKRRITNRLSPINFMNDIEKIETAFENVCKDFEGYKEIEVDKKDLSLKIKWPYYPSEITYRFIIYERRIEVYFLNYIQPVGQYILDGLDKGYYDFGIEQTEHKCLAETINYEEIIDKLMERVVQ